MKTRHRPTSLFHERIDRALFAVYFLSAVIPLGAFMYVGNRYALPALEDDMTAMLGMAGLMLGIGMLSLVSFFALRRIVAQSIDSMNGDNERLQRVLKASSELSEAPHSQAVFKAALEWARRLSGAGTALFVLPSEGDKAMELLAALGKGEVFFEKQKPMLYELVATAVSENRTVTLEDDAAGKGSILVAPFPKQADNGGAIVVVRKGNAEGFRSSEMDTLSMLSAITSVSLHNADLQDAQRNFFTYVTELVVMAVDSHVSYRDGHSKKVAELANRIGRELNLSDEQLHVLHFSSLLHDIGMLKLSRAQHTSPQHYQQHPVIANKMLARIRLWGDVAPVVLHHHERFDGTGYPTGLAAQDIPLESRVLCVADAVDAMSRDDNRRTGMSLEDICEELRECAGTHFDPTVVQAFLRTVERGEIELAS